MVDITNPSNYKKCQKKTYDIHVCMPEKDTVVINKLEQPQVIKQIGGRQYFTAVELSNMSKRNPQKFSVIRNLISKNLVYVVTAGNDFVLAGTLGELWIISPQKLAQKYVFLQNNQPVAINQGILQQRMVGEVLPWTVIRTKPDTSAAWACFVPRSQKGQVNTAWGTVLSYNAPGSTHGKGDFIIAADAGGVPNLNDVYVVNGNIFATTYSNKGWEDCLDSRHIGPRSAITINDLPVL